MAKQSRGDEELPPELQAEVDKIRSEGEETPPEDEREAVPVERAKVPGSRRAEKEREREETIRQAAERAERAESAIDELRRAREEDRERFGRMQALLEGQVQSRTTTVQGGQSERDDEEGDLEGKYNRQMAKAKAALAEGKLDEYHERLTKAMDARQKAREREIVKRFPQAQAPQPQKPTWVSAVESKFPDVLTHARGVNTVVAFAQMEDGPMGPEKLEKAYARARKELGLGGEEKTPPNNGKQRQMLSGGPVNGGGSGKGAGGKAQREQFVNVPTNFRAIAKANGMTPEEYIKSYAAMNPGEITRE